MNKKHQVFIQLFVIVLATIIAYLPSLKNDFTNWDDPTLVVDNAHIRSLSADNLRSFFSTSYGGFGGYTPLVFISYALDYRLFGLDSRAFHATNLLLHVLNSLLIYALLYLLSGQLSVSFVVAVLFGLHPLHVEAVAWTQGRKDLLFSLFYVAALCCYTLFVQKKQKRSYYILAFVLFVLSLFSKVTAISFPLVIFLVEFYRSKRIDKSSVVRSIPFVIVSAVVLSLAFITNTSAPSPPAENASYLQNLGLFFYAFVFYAAKVFWPVGLIARYSMNIGQYPWQILINLAIFAVMAVFIYLAHRRKPETVVFGIAFSILTLAPTLPFHFSGQPYADRYMYLPVAGLLFIAAAMLVSLLSGIPETSPKRRWGAWLPLLLIVVLFGLQTFKLSGVWHDSFSLWTHVLEKDPKNATAYLKRSEAFDAAGRTDKALDDLARAAQFSPRDPNVYNNRGVIYFRQAQYEKAMSDYDRALSLNPFYVMGYINRGILWGRLGEFEKAVKDFSMVLAMDNRSYLAYYYRGLALKELNKVDLAIKDLETAYRLNPTGQVLGQIELLKRPKTPLPK
jgi:tetratricopeptide (TPR) repeat protein